MQSNDKYGRNYVVDREIVYRRLEQTTEFMNALKTPVGKILFEDLADILTECFTKIYTEVATERDKAMFSVCKEIGDRWNKRMDIHVANMDKFKTLEAKQ
jgi:hypothetical protein